MVETKSKLFAIQYFMLVKIREMIHYECRSRTQALRELLFRTFNIFNIYLYTFRLITFTCNSSKPG